MAQIYAKGPVYILGTQEELDVIDNSLGFGFEVKKVNVEYLTLADTLADCKLFQRDRDIAKPTYNKIQMIETIRDYFSRVGKTVSLKEAKDVVDFVCDNR